MTTQEAIRWYESKLFVNERFRLLGTQNEAAKLALAALRTQEERERNDPLTLEELLEMDGEPVWTTQTDYAFEPCWMLVKAKINYVLADWQFCPFDTYGETWLAYRYKPGPPEEGETDGKSML